MSITSPDRGLGRRERKKRETRQALQAAALRLAAERGAAAVTVEEIADAANVSPRTFFNYFSSKEQAVIGHDPERATRLHEALLARPAGEAPFAALRAVLVEMAQEMSADHDEWQRRVQVIKANPDLRAAHHGAWSEVERGMVDAIAARTGTDPDRDQYPALVVAAAIAANRVAVMHWKGERSRGGDATLPALVAEALDQLAAGLPPPAAR